MIKIIYQDKEIGVEDQNIGTINYEITLNEDITGYDVIDAIVKVMRVAEFHPDTIDRALRAALGIPEEKIEKIEE